MDAFKFSQTYVEILEENLRPKKEGDKILISWTIDTPYNLLNDLKYLFKKHWKDAVESIDQIDGLKSFHFGPSKNPLEVVKYSLFFTDKIIMQDLLYRFLFLYQGYESKVVFKIIVPIAIEVLRWKDLIEGAVNLRVY